MVKAWPDVSRVDPSARELFIERNEIVDGSLDTQRTVSDFLPRWLNPPTVVID
jgi:hypothetical protein